MKKGSFCRKRKTFYHFSPCPFSVQALLSPYCGSTQKLSTDQFFAGNFSMCAVIDNKVNGLLVEKFEMSSWMKTIWWNILLEWKSKEEWGLDTTKARFCWGQSGLWALPNLLAQKMVWYSRKFKKWLLIVKISGNQPQLKKEEMRFYLKISEGWYWPPPCSHFSSHLILLLCPGGLASSSLILLNGSFPLQLLWCPAI